MRLNIGNFSKLLGLYEEQNEFRQRNAMEKCREGLLAMPNVVFREEIAKK
jgi:hypothetical protein